MRIGHGYDVHKLVENRKLILGGVHIPYEKGLLGHSDADVLAHAIADALLGAATLGGIGVLLIAVAVIWVIVSAVHSNRSKNGNDVDSDDPFDAPYNSNTTAFSTDSDKSPLSERS